MKNHLLLSVIAACLFGCAIHQKTASPKIEFRPVVESTITNLYDAFGKNEHLKKDFGFSCVLNYRGKTILFDAGSNADFFKQNTDALGVDLRKIDFAIVSHAHMDHLNGIDYLLSINPTVKIYFPDDFFWGSPVPFDATGQVPSIKDSLPKEMQYFDGGPTRFKIEQSGRFWHANIEFIKENTEIMPGIRLIATTSPFLGYFSKYPNLSFVENKFQDNKTPPAPGNESLKLNNLPEISLSLDTEKGEVVIVGCSHSTIQQIVEETRRFTKRDIELVYGGFHLLPYKMDDIEKLATYLKTDMHVHKIAPAHCTGHLGFKILRDRFGGDYVYAGLGETIQY